MTRAQLSAGVATQEAYVFSGTVQIFGQQRLLCNFVHICAKWTEGHIILFDESWVISATFARRRRELCTVSLMRPCCVGIAITGEMLPLRDASRWGCRAVYVTEVTRPVWALGVATARHVGCQCWLLYLLPPRFVSFWSRNPQVFQVSFSTSYQPRVAARPTYFWVRARWMFAMTKLVSCRALRSIGWRPWVLTCIDDLIGALDSFTVFPGVLLLDRAVAGCTAVRTSPRRRVPPSC